MEKYIYDNSNGLQYELQEDYDIPCLVLPDTEERPIGIWGRKHQQYLREHRPIIYSDLVLSGKLYGYLADIDKQAEDMFFRLVEQMTEREGVTERLKAGNQMEWVARMNNIRSRATEIVNHDIIYN